MKKLKKHLPTLISILIVLLLIYVQTYIFGQPRPTLIDVVLLVGIYRILEYQWINEAESKKLKERNRDGE